MPTDQVLSQPTLANFQLLKLELESYKSKARSYEEMYEREKEKNRIYEREKSEQRKGDQDRNARENSYRADLIDEVKKCEKLRRRNVELYEKIPDSQKEILGSEQEEEEEEQELKKMKKKKKKKKHQSTAEKVTVDDESLVASGETIKASRNSSLEANASEDLDNPQERTASPTSRKTSTESTISSAKMGSISHNSRIPRPRGSSLQYSPLLPSSSSLDHAITSTRHLRESSLNNDESRSQQGDYHEAIDGVQQQPQQPPPPINRNSDHQAANTRKKNDLRRPLPQRGDDCIHSDHRRNAICCGNKPDALGIDSPAAAVDVDEDFVSAGEEVEAEDPSGHNRQWTGLKAFTRSSSTSLHPIQHQSLSPDSDERADTDTAHNDKEQHVPINIDPEKSNLLPFPLGRDEAPINDGLLRVQLDAAQPQTTICTEDQHLTFGGHKEQSTSVKHAQRKRSFSDEQHQAFLTAQQTQISLGKEQVQVRQAVLNDKVWPPSDSRSEIPAPIPKKTLEFLYEDVNDCLKMVERLWDMRVTYEPKLELIKSEIPKISREHLWSRLINSDIDSCEPQHETSATPLNSDILPTKSTQDRENDDDEENLLRNLETTVRELDFHYCNLTGGKCALRTYESRLEMALSSSSSPGNKRGRRQRREREDANWIREDRISTCVEDTYAKCRGLKERMPLLKERADELHNRAFWGMERGF